VRDQLTPGMRYWVTSGSYSSAYRRKADDPGVPGEEPSRCFLVEKVDPDTTLWTPGLEISTTDNCSGEDSEEHGVVIILPKFSPLDRNEDSKMGVRQASFAAVRDGLLSLVPLLQVSDFELVELIPANVQWKGQLLISFPSGFIDDDDVEGLHNLRALVQELFVDLSMILHRHAILTIQGRERERVPFFDFVTLFQEGTLTSNQTPNEAASRCLLFLCLVWVSLSIASSVVVACRLCPCCCCCRKVVYTRVPHAERKPP
ncbi:hypothetical protein, partial [Litorimonas sp.]|uniref:hypothetical protein n=1 Tax=Litorimonas sp. TaxID=1892381 RepID=UPI003A88CC2A